MRNFNLLVRGRAGDRPRVRRRCWRRDSGAAVRSRSPSSPRGTTSTETGSSISGTRSARTSRWTHLQHPAALEFFDPAIADTFDVYAFYDAPGRTATPGPGREADVRAAERIGEEEPDPVPAEREGSRVLPSLARRVEPHVARVQRDDRHGVRLGQSSDVQGQDVSELGRAGRREAAHHGRQQDASDHAGLGDGFDIVDETYLCPVDEKAKGLIPLLRPTSSRSTRTSRAGMPAAGAIPASEASSRVG